jgi:4'-phosphopantetheinyl transferase
MKQSAAISSADLEPGKLAPLSPGEWRLYQFTLAVPPLELEALWLVLPGAERDQVDRFLTEEARRRFVVRRAMRRRILAFHLGCAPEEVRVAETACGQPYLFHPPRSPGLCFSASHSAESCLVALAWGRRIGVDIERHRPLDGDLAAVIRCFAAEEQEAFDALPAADRARAFFDCWTRKEAFLKALGLGLSLPLDRFVVSVRPDEPAALRAVAKDPGAPDRWAMFSLDLGRGWSGTVVIGGA